MKTKGMIVLWLFAVVCSLQVQATDVSNNSTTTTTTTTTTTPASAGRSMGGGVNKQTAPYAIEDQDNGVGKDIVFRLTLNQTSEAALNLTSDQWKLVGQNGTVLGERASVDLKKLLEMLNSNNYTSEVRYDDLQPGLVNITISNWQGGQQAGSNQMALLEDLLDESKFEPALNLSSVVRDNHRLVVRAPARSRPQLISTIEQPATVASLLMVPSSMTVPPIRRTQDVVAENYTVKKIANEANIFALKLLEQLNLERLGNENLIMSPFSIYQGLGLLLSGATGDTSRELDRLLLSVQSVYENTRLTHDQDRVRLMASFGDCVRQLERASTNHFQVVNDAETLEAHLMRALVEQAQQYNGGSQEQHFIVANNLLFSPQAYEISQEFKSTLSSYYNNTALTKMEVGSTESIQVVNGWIRQATAGLIPTIINKKSTFDEFNVMTLLSSSWLAQEWRNSFRRVASPLRSNVRLRGQTGPILRGGRVAAPGNKQAAEQDEPLMEFVDDQKVSHFTEYIQSEPTRQIHNYHAYLNKQLVDVVVVPFRNSNQRLVALTPLVGGPSSNGNSILASINQQLATVLANQTMELNLEPEGEQPSRQPQATPSESSYLSKMIANFASEPRRVLRQLWMTIAPEIITRQSIQNMRTPPINLLRTGNNSSGQYQQVVDIQLNNNAPPIPPKVQLSMPLIRLEADSTISAALNHVGLVNAFDPAQANFIGINGHPFNYNKLHLSNVIYKTTLNLNEDGINYDRTVRTLESMRILPQKRVKEQQQQRQEMDLEPGELVNEVHLDKPFMFLICDIKTRLILYTGVVRNPAK